MQVSIEGRCDDPRERILAIEAATRAICQNAGQDPADGVMMLLTAAVHMHMTYAKPSMSVAAVAHSVAEALGYAVIAADDFFKLRQLRSVEREKA